MRNIRYPDPPGKSKWLLSNFRRPFLAKVPKPDRVTDGSYSANYSYLANSPLVSQIDFKQSRTSGAIGVGSTPPAGRPTCSRISTAWASSTNKWNRMG
jgi:hypothetical protein